MIHRRFPILTRIILFQIAITTLGVAGLYVAQRYASTLNRRVEIGRLKELIKPTLLERQEQWRAWTYLNVGSPVETEMKDVKQRFGLKRLAVVPMRKVRNLDAMTRLVVPDHVTDPDDLVVVADIQPTRFTGIGDGWTLSALLLFFALVLAISFGVGRYIYARIYRPMLNLGRILSTPENYARQLAELSAQGEMAGVIDSVRSILDQLRAFEKEAAFAEVAAQVSHDIRSPLTALDLVSGTLDDLDEDKRVLIRAAVRRIKDISDTLARGSAPEASAGTVKISLLPALIESIAAEKRAEYRSLDGFALDFEVNVAGDLFARVDPAEFKRLVSNLINNAVEASRARPRVRLRLAGDSERVVVSVEDEGLGIDPAILPHLGTRGYTRGKPSGRGLGIYHAKASVESWGGNLRIASRVGAGSTVSVSLPRVAPPRWAVASLTFQPGTEVVIVDDDQSIHHVWLERFRTSGQPHGEWRLRRFDALDAFTAWWTRLSASDRERRFVLIDHEFKGCAETGLDAIIRLELGPQTVLVTSRADETALLERCEAAGVRVLPKGLAPFVPIVSAGRAREASATL